MWQLLSVTVQEEEKAFTRCLFHQEEYSVKVRKRNISEETNHVVLL